MKHDRRYDPDVTRHISLIESIVTQLLKGNCCPRWSPEELRAHVMAEAHIVLEQYYEPDRGTVATYLCRFMKRRVITLYCAEHGRPRPRRDRRYDRPRGIAATDMDQDSWMARLVDRTTPLEALMQQESRECGRRVISGMMADSPSDGERAYLWARLGSIRLAAEQRSESRGSIHGALTRLKAQHRDSQPCD